MDGNKDRNGKQKNKTFNEKCKLDAMLAHDNQKPMISYVLYKI
jgi:hypothetical protein